MLKKALLLSSLVLMVGALIGCGGPADTGGGDGGGDFALRVTGSVDKEMGWTEDEAKAMDTIDAQSTNKDGETKTYTGVPINTLLGLAGVKDGATTVVYVAGDEYTAELPLADVEGCADCIVSFRNQGGFSIVMPGFSSKLQVKDVVEIQVK